MGRKKIYRLQAGWGGSDSRQGGAYAPPCQTIYCRLRQQARLSWRYFTVADWALDAKLCEIDRNSNLY